MKRNEQMVKYWERGWTLGRLAKKYGITRQCVQQTLRRMGAGAGGNEVTREAREKKRAKKREVKMASARRQADANCRARWGISKDEYDMLRGMEDDLHKTPMYKFKFARRAKLKAGIDWELNFAEWWAIWKRSGKYDQLGNSMGKYMLVRKQNRGSYKRGNVVVMPVSDFFIMVRANANNKT